MSDRVHAAVKAIIEKDGKYLIIEQDIGNRTLWDLPGGRINYGESPYDSLHREVLEEVGLVVEVVRCLGMFWFFRDEDRDEVVCTTFLCRIVSGKVDLSQNPDKDEHIQNYEWVTKEAFLSGAYDGADPSQKALFELL